MQNTDTAPLFAGPLIAVVFPFFWCFICWLLARMGGWSRWADLYPNPAGHRGDVLWMQSGAFGWSNYNSVLKLSADPQGLALSVILPFRFGHSPILIPWSELEVSRKSGFFGSYATLTAREAPGVKLKLAGGTWDRLRQAAGSAALLASESS